VSNLQLALWAVVPPVLLLIYYSRRVANALPLSILLFFVVGAISGFVALGLEWGFEAVASQLVSWDRITRSLPGVAIRQLVEVGPIEEGSKLSGVVFTNLYLQRRHLWRPRQRSAVLLATIAVSLGFTAQENWVYFYHNAASVLERLIGTPVHAFFSAPWGYALTVASTLGLAADSSVVRAWLNAVICHALVNVLSSAARYSPPLSFLSYGLFPFLLWMFWRLEGLLRRSQGKLPLAIISSSIRIHRYWQRGLALFALLLGGNAIFGFFLLVREISPLSLSQLFSPVFGWFILSRLLNLIPGVLAWAIYRYLRYLARR